MNQYLTIGEFAKLRGVNINSLLYYEKLGILRPAWIDPDTRYRYYAPEQLSALDIILLCISLDIPLKELKQYQDENTYWQKKMLEDGKRIAEDKIQRMQSDLHKIEYSLKWQEDQDQYADRGGNPALKRITILPSVCNFAIILFILRNEIFVSCSIFLCVTEPSARIISNIISSS